MLLVLFMKIQTGVRIEAEVWQEYKKLCSRDRLRPSLPIEEFLKSAVDNESILGFLTLLRGSAKSKSEGINANARVLLNWYMQGKYFFHAPGNDEAPVEGLLLEALKTITDPELSQQIEKTLIAAHQKVSP
jgi:hypothetical protein